MPGNSVSTICQNPLSEAENNDGFAHQYDSESTLSINQDLKILAFNGNVDSPRRKMPMGVERAKN